MWSLTVSERRPLARRRESTLRPSLLAILSRKPCLFTRRRLEGWKVLFIFVYRYLFNQLMHTARRTLPVSGYFGLQNYKTYFRPPNNTVKIIYFQLLLPWNLCMCGIFCYFAADFAISGKAGSVPSLKTWRLTHRIWETYVYCAVNPNLIFVIKKWI